MAMGITCAKCKQNIILRGNAGLKALAIALEKHQAKCGVR